MSTDQSALAVFRVRNGKLTAFRAITTPMR